MQAQPGLLLQHCRLTEDAAGRDCLKRRLAIFWRGGLIPAELYPAYYLKKKHLVLQPRLQPLPADHGSCLVLPCGAAPLLYLELKRSGLFNALTRMRDLLQNLNKLIYLLIYQVLFQEDSLHCFRPHRGSYFCLSHLKDPHALTARLGFLNMAAEQVQQTLFFRHHLQPDCHYLRTFACPPDLPPGSRILLQQYFDGRASEAAVQRAIFKPPAIPGRAGPLTAEFESLEVQSEEYLLLRDRELSCKADLSRLLRMVHKQRSTLLIRLTGGRMSSFFKLLDYKTHPHFVQPVFLAGAGAAAGGAGAGGYSDGYSWINSDDPSGEHSAEHSGGHTEGDETAVSTLSGDEVCGHGTAFGGYSAFGSGTAAGEAGEERSESEECRLQTGQSTAGDPAPEGSESSAASAASSAGAAGEAGSKACSSCQRLTFKNGRQKYELYLYVLHDPELAAERRRRLQQHIKLMDELWQKRLQLPDRADLLSCLDLKSLKPDQPLPWSKKKLPQLFANASVEYVVCSRPCTTQQLVSMEKMCRSLDDCADAVELDLALEPDQIEKLEIVDYLKGRVLLNYCCMELQRALQRSLQQNSAFKRRFASCSPGSLRQFFAAMDGVNLLLGHDSCRVLPPQREQEFFLAVCRENFSPAEIERSMQIILRRDLKQFDSRCLTAVNDELLQLLAG